MNLAQLYEDISEAVQRSIAEARLLRKAQDDAVHSVHCQVAKALRDEEAAKADLAAAQTLMKQAPPPANASKEMVALRRQVMETRAEAERLGSKVENLRKQAKYLEGQAAAVDMELQQYRNNGKLNFLRELAGVEVASWHPREDRVSGDATILRDGRTKHIVMPVKAAYARAEYLRQCDIAWQDSPYTKTSFMQLHHQGNCHRSAAN